MPYYTFRDFVGELAEMPVVGVVRNYGWQPITSLNTQDLPAQTVRLPRGDLLPWVYADGASHGILTAEVMIFTEPVAQKDPESNFIEAVMMMDNLSAALYTLNCGISRAWFSVRQSIFTVAAEDYWGIQALVSTRGRPNAASPAT